MYWLFIWCHNRHILAAIHFNFNLMQDTKKKADGSEQIRVLYPKFKNGEASIRDIRIEQNFGKKHQPLFSVNHTCRLIDVEFFFDDLFYPVSYQHTLSSEYFLCDLHFWVKVKNSFPKSLSADCRYTVGQLSAGSIPTVNRQLTNSKPTLKIWQV